MRSLEKEIKKVDIPYMQRNNGAWDNSDVVVKGLNIIRSGLKPLKNFPEIVING